MQKFETQIDLEMKAIRIAELQTKSDIYSNADGKGSLNPYASTVQRNYLPLLSNLIAEDLLTVTEYRYVPSHFACLMPLNPDEVSYLTINTVLDIISSSGDSADNFNSHSNSIGNMIRVLSITKQLQDEQPNLYRKMMQEFKRRNSDDFRYRRRSLQKVMANNGITPSEWNSLDERSVGTYLLGLCEQAGLIKVFNFTDKSHKTSKVVTLTDDALDMVMSGIDRSIDQAFSRIPLIEKPLDWSDFYNGGYHTEMARCRSGGFLSVPSFVEERMDVTEFEPLFEVVNHLQKTEWQVNPDMLSRIGDIMRVSSLKDLRLEMEMEQPVFLGDVEDEDAFKTWKRHAAYFHEARKEHLAKVMRVSRTLAQARQFSVYDKIWFSWFVDFRYRMYPSATGLSPQGNDLGKSLLRFAEGRPLDSESAVMWFKASGAGRYGYDKKLPERRAEWVDDNHDMIMAVAENPLVHREWEDADSPLQFVAWAIEYRRYKLSPATFVSHLPVGMDGTCNGFQHLSACLYDPIGAKSVNLCATVGDDAEKEDIYGIVAEKCTARLHTMTGESEYAIPLLKDGVSRSVVKRNVMTTPYGVTARTAAMNIQGESFKTGSFPSLPEASYAKAAYWFVREIQTPALQDTVAKAVEAMAWLQDVAKEVTHDGTVLSWKTPLGMTVYSPYFKSDNIRCRMTYNDETLFLTTKIYKDSANKSKSVSGIAPNFTHSLDACHLQLTVRTLKQKNIHTMAMIHDDYGCHASDAQVLFDTIRDTFVDMYSKHNPLQELADRWGIDNCPERGDFDIQEVKKSKFFFS